MGNSFNSDWMMASSASTTQTGDVLSTAAASITDWSRVDLPTTVLGALVERGEFGDPFVDKNLLSIPGQGPCAENFSNFPMPDDSPFAVPWWFRKQFVVDTNDGPHLVLQFDGINYRANVWLNGKLIADKTQVVGSYCEHRLDITQHVQRDRLNTLAVEVFPPGPQDVAITWVDWNPSPPDKNTGIWRDVQLHSSGPVALLSPHVATEITGPHAARLTIGGDVVNLDDQPQETIVQAEVAGHRVSIWMMLKAGEQRRFERQLDLVAPSLWWPRSMGDPALYELKVEVLAGDVPSDSQTLEFGIRQVTAEITEEGHALFRINGKPVLIRGAGWATDLFLRRQPKRDRAQLDYVIAMNLNTIRFEGMLERTEFLEWCDREGILVIAGWCCCDCWEKWDSWNEETHQVAAASLRSQIRRVRRHPCMISWWYGSDFPPPAEVERSYLDILAEEQWPNASHSSAADKATELSGSSGMKMEGPYDYVPPNYWLEDDEHGGAFGFATEVCPGPAPPPLESLRRMFSEDNLWPINDTWNLHAGGQEFHNIKAFTDALTARYGDVEDVEQFTDLSQLMTYEAQRAMFEAYARNRYRATGVIHWMLNNAWPSLIWHLYDYYLRPGGGFFGTRKANEPLHVMYAYDDATVSVVNDHMEPATGLNVHVRVFDLGMEPLFDEIAMVDVDGGGNTRVLTIPGDGDQDVRLVDLRMTSVEGALLSHNFYWLPATLDELDHDNASWINTPISRYADLRSLRELPSTPLAVSAKRAKPGNGSLGRVELTNDGDSLAFFVQLRLVDERGEDFLPVLWSDNYVSLLPGDTCVVQAALPGNPSVNGNLRLQVRGLNVPAQELPLPPAEDP